MYFKLFMAIGIFCAGGMVTANLMLLGETNPEYIGEWWKFWMHLVFGIMLIYGVTTSKQ